MPDFSGRDITIRDIGTRWWGILLPNKECSVQAAEAYKTTLAYKTFPRGIHAAYGFVLLNQHDYAGAERELNAELASNRGSLMAKLGLARLRVEQGAAAEGVKEIAEIWKADPGFLRANVPLFNAGLPEPTRSELQRIVEKARANDEIPADIALPLNSSRPLRPASTRLIPRVFAPENAGSTEKAAASGNAIRQRRSWSVWRSAGQGTSAASIGGATSLLAACAYSTANYQTAFDSAQKLAAAPATEAEGCIGKQNRHRSLLRRLWRVPVNSTPHSPTTARIAR